MGSTPVIQPDADAVPPDNQGPPQKCPFNHGVTAGANVCPAGPSPGDPYYASAEFQTNATYREEPRPPLKSVSDLSLRTLGNLLETLVDLQYSFILNETPGATVRVGDPGPVKPERIPPAYVFRAFGDLRSTQSFFVGEKARDWPTLYPKEVRHPKTHQPAQGKKIIEPYPDVAELSHTEHSAVRQAGAEIGRTALDDVVLPDNIKEALKRMHALIAQDYTTTATKLGKQHQSLESIRREANAINTMLLRTFSHMDSFTVIVPARDEEGKVITEGGRALTHSYVIPNDKPINPDMPETKPLLMLHALTFSGERGVDGLRMPDLDNDPFTRSLGVESIITKNSEPLLEFFKQHTHGEMTFPRAEGLNKLGIEEALKRSSRNLSLLYQASKVLGNAYPVAYDDIERQLGMVGQKIERPMLKTPDEIATMLYVTARRLERDAPAPDDVAPGKFTRKFASGSPYTGDAITDDLLRLAEKVAKTRDMTKAANLIIENVKTMEAAQFAAETLAKRAPANESAGRPDAGLKLINDSLRLVPGIEQRSSRLLG